MSVRAMAHTVAADNAGPPAVVSELCGPAAGPAPVEWTWSPWREHPGRAAVALAFTLGGFALVLAMTVSAVLAVLLAFAIGGTLAPLLVPSRCRIDGRGVALRSAFGWERRAWVDLKRVRPGRDAIVVSPFVHPRRLDVFRALVLPIPTHRRDVVLAAVRAHCDHHSLAAGSLQAPHEL